MNRGNDNNNPKGYHPVLQQPYCCVPACLHMVFNRHGLKRFSQERIAKRLGLIVPRSSLKDFSYRPLTQRNGREGGYGVQCDEEEFNLPDACVTGSCHYPSASSSPHKSIQPRSCERHCSA